MVIGDGTIELPNNLKMNSNLILTLFLPGEGGISPLIVCHVTKSVRNRVKPITRQVHTLDQAGQKRGAKYG